MTGKLLKLPAQAKSTEDKRKLPENKQSLRWYMQEYHQHLRQMNFSPHTIKNHRTFFGKFLRWCEERSVCPEDVTQPLIERFQRYLYQYRDPEDGTSLSIDAQRKVVLAIRAFFKWMRRRGFLASNPASDIDIPRPETRLPLNPLTTQEVEKILSLPDVKTANGLMDRALLEVLYSTGIRRSEIANLSIYDINRQRGILLVQQGKGKKDRVVPIGERAIAWVEQYLTEGRPALVAEPDHGKLFVQSRGGPIAPKVVGYIVKGYIDKADIGKKGSCHLFRHAMATALLENGAEIKFLQQMLGHEDLRSTQAYGKVSIRKLKEAHTRLHPAALLKRSRTKKYKP